MIKYSSPTQQESGFALLITLIVVGVVLSIGLSILDLSIKQVKLSTNAKESEIAFHAANAGMECARFIRRTEAADMELGNSITPDCFDAATTPSITPTPLGSPTQIDDDSDAEVYVYEYEFTWGNSNDRCSQITAVVASSSALGDGVTINNIVAHVDGYPDPDGGGEPKFCDPGSRCTTLSVRGYNKPCANLSEYGTIEREVLLQF